MVPGFSGKKKITYFFLVIRRKIKPVSSLNLKKKEREEPGLTLIFMDATLGK